MTRYTREMTEIEKLDEDIELCITKLIELKTDARKRVGNYTNANQSAIKRARIEINKILRRNEESLAKLDLLDELIDYTDETLEVVEDEI